MKMKFGMCAGLEKMGEVAALGFDYIEPSVSGVAAMTDEEFAAALAAAKEAGLPCPAFNVLFPGTMLLLGDEAKDAEIAAYLNKAFARVQALGGKTVVFGSGKSRRRPDGTSYGDAFRRLVEVTRLIGEIAQQYGVTIVIEPLNREETNMINSMAEGAALAAAVNHPNVALLSDYFHVAKESEPVEDIVRLGGVCHTHMATKEGRRYPMEADEGIRAFFASLKAAHYTGMMSIEGKTDDMAADAPVALKVLKKLWEEN